MYESNFIDACLFGETDLDELDDYIDYWHDNETGNTLREFLGMTPYEYEEWLKHDDTILRDILRCRKDGVPYERYPEMTTDERIAARSRSLQDIKGLKDGSK